MSEGSIWESLDNIIKGVGNVANTTLDTISIFKDDDAERAINATTEASTPAVAPTPSVSYQGGFTPSNSNMVLPAVILVGGAILYKLVVK